MRKEQDKTCQLFYFPKEKAEVEKDGLGQAVWVLILKKYGGKKASITRSFSSLLQTMDSCSLILLINRNEQKGSKSVALFNIYSYILVCYII